MDVQGKIIIKREDLIVPMAAHLNCEKSTAQKMTQSKKGGDL